MRKKGRPRIPDDPKKRVDRREQIIQAAIESYKTLGPAQTKFAQLAKATSLDPSLLLYYFPTADSLNEVIFERIFESLHRFTMEQVEEAGHDPVRALRQYIRAPFRWSEAERGYFSIWMYFYHLASFQPLFANSNTRIRERGRERIAMMIYRGVELKKFKLNGEYEVIELAELVQTLITGHVIVQFSESVPRKGASQTTEALILSLLGIKK